MVKDNGVLGGVSSDMDHHIAVFCLNFNLITKGSVGLEGTARSDCQLDASKIIAFTTVKQTNKGYNRKR